MQTLRETGAWLQVNGGAIYGSRRWDFASDMDAVDETEKYNFANPPHINRWDFKKFNNDDIRYTRSKGGRYVYGFSLGAPSREQVVAKRLGHPNPGRIRIIRSVPRINAEGLLSHNQFLPRL